MPERPGIQCQEDEPCRRVADGERLSGSCFTDRNGYGNHGDSHHLRPCEQPVDEVIRVIPVGIEGVAGPQPPHQHKVGQIRSDACPRDFVNEAGSHHGNRGNEREVVEEFEPGGGPFRFLERSQARRRHRRDPHSGTDSPG